MVQGTTYIRTRINSIKYSMKGGGTTRELSILSVEILFDNVTKVRIIFQKWNGSTRVNVAKRTSVY